MKTNKVIRGTVVNTVGSVEKYMPSPDVLAFFDNLVSAFREEQKTQRDLAQIGAKRDLLIAEVTRRFELYQSVFDNIFAERKDAVDKHFELVERGIATNNKELIVHGLQGISTIVASSPFANIQELSKLMESGQRIDI
jgi:hypothetical protein